MTRSALWLALAFLGACAGGASSSDGGGDASTDAATSTDLGDGVPIRNMCTSSFGSALNSPYGRLDGELVALVPPGHHGCNGDSDHFHLQVRSSGSIYDIAITVTDLNGGAVDYIAVDRPLFGAPWAEGWHADASIDYVTLGLHAADFAPTAKATLTQDIQTELATATRVSIFASSYTDGTGAHKVHRNGGNTDGALVIRPLAAVSRALLFHFSTQTF